MVPVRSLTARVLKSLNSDRHGQSGTRLQDDQFVQLRSFDKAAERRKSSVEQLAEKIEAARIEKEQMSTRLKIFNTLADPTHSKTGIHISLLLSS